MRIMALIDDAGRRSRRNLQGLSLSCSERIGTSSGLSLLLFFEQI